jgi:haloalkane dehalogenase
MEGSHMTTSSTISPDYPFAPHDVEVHGSRLHYIDEGSGDPILYLHGNPTWSYVWRNIIPHVTPFGRCIAPDLIGMGRSAKPDIEYRLVDHIKYVEGFIEQLGLKNITLVLHDWGSVIGFHYATRHEHNIKGLAFMEAALHPMPGWDDLPPDNRSFFQTVKGPNSWDLIVNQNMFIEQLLQRLVLRQLTPEEMTYYREPYLEPSSRKPLWRWPQEVSIGGDPADVQAIASAYSQKLPQSDLPKLLFYGSPGFILPAPLVEWCRHNLKNLTIVDVGPGNHILQEENPQLIGAELARWYRTLSHL